MVERQFFNETAGNAAGPLAINAPVCRMDDGAAALRAGYRDIGQSAFFFQRSKPAFIKRALRWEYPFLPSDEEDIVIFKALGGVNGHYCDACAGIAAVIVHHQADMLQEVTQRFVFVHRAGQFGEVFQTARAFGALFGLERGGVGALVEHGPTQFGGAERFGEVTAKARTLPDLYGPTAAVNEEKSMGTWLPIRSVIAGAPPL